MAALPHLIRDLIELALDADEVPQALVEQLDDLCEKSRHNTGVGVFVDIVSCFGREYDGTDCLLDAALISCPEVPGGADSIVHVRKGRVVQVEILARSGSFPTELRQSYHLHQQWNGAAGKWIEVKNGTRTHGAGNSLDR